MLPPTAEISSSVQTFFGFFFSLAWSFTVLWSLTCGAAAAGGWDCGAGLAESESEPDWEDCAGQFRVAKKARTKEKMSKRRMKPPGRFPFEVRPIQEVYRPTNQRSPAAEAGLPKSASPSSFRTATRASLGGPM